MQRLEVSGAVRPIYGSLGVKRLNKSPIRCNSTQSDLFHCKVTLHVSGVTAPIIRSTKHYNRSLRYRSYCEIQGLTGMNYRRLLTSDSNG